MGKSASFTNLDCIQLLRVLVPVESPVMNSSSLDYCPEAVCPTVNSVQNFDSGAELRLDGTNVVARSQGKSVKRSAEIRYLGGRNFIRRTAFASALDPIWAEQIHRAPESLYEGATAWLKLESRRRAALVNVAVGERQMNWFVKETQSKSWRVWIAAQFSICRSVNAFHQGLAFSAAGISTPRPVACSTLVRQGYYLEYLVTDALPQTIPLNVWLQRHPRHFENVRENGSRDYVIRELARQLQMMHQNRFDHRDLKSSNVLVATTSASPQLWLIDLDGVWRWPLLPRARIVQNLARLWVGVVATGQVSRADGLRFLKAYLAEEVQQDWKRMWKLIAHRVRRKLSLIQFRKTAAAKAHGVLSAGN